MSERKVHVSKTDTPVIQWVVKSLILLAGLFSILLLFSCNKNKGELTTEYEKGILRYRAQKDSAFKFADWSPLLPEDKAHFRGLKYFPVDPAFRFEGPIVQYHPMELDTIVGTGGDLRPALKFGYFEFQYQGKSYRLQIYKILTKNAPDSGHLFLGFTDATSGKETYGGGRYVDLIKIGNNDYIVDFNFAYNPYCAYNPRYSCAIPPAENRLPFPVTAGEKIFKQH